MERLTRDSGGPNLGGLSPLVKYSSMKTTRLLVTLLGATLSAFAAEPAFKSLPVGATPESVVPGFGGKLFVTLMGTKREKGDGDGKIVNGDGESRPDRIHWPVVRGNANVLEILVEYGWGIRAVHVKNEEHQEWQLQLLRHFDANS